jgi:cytoskeleton protein RodZ
MSDQQELIPMRPGDMLRHAREQKKLGLDEAAERSRIRASVLAAIESGETSAIPTVYLRGYMRNYARFLGVDPAEIERRMEDVHGAEPEVRPVFPGQSPRRSSERWLKFSSYVAASALIATLTWQFTHEAVKWSQGESAPREPVVSAPGPADASELTSQRNAHLNASIASMEMISQRGQLAGAAAAEQAWSAVGRESEHATGLRTLEITTSADSWVEILGRDDRRLEQDLIRAGTHRQYIDDGPFRIMVGQAGAVLVALDGEAVDLAPHTRDGVARLTLPAKAPDETDEAAQAEPEAH